MALPAHGVAAPAAPSVPWTAPAIAALFVGWLALSQVRGYFELWPGVSVWYAPAALLAAGCILWGWRAVLPLFAAAIALELTMPRVGEPLWRFLFVSLLLKAIYAAGAEVLRRRGFDSCFTTPRDVLRFAIYVATCAFLAGGVGVGDLVGVGVIPRAAWGRGTLAFWVGDVVAVLALTPALLVIAHRYAGHRAPARRWRYRAWRAPAQILTVPLALWVTFGLAPHLGFLSYSICFLPLGWVALTQGVRGAALMTAALTVGAVVILQSSGLVPRDNLELQTFMASLALAGLLLGSVADQGERGQALLAESEERYRALVELLPVPLVVHREGRALFANPAAARTFGAPSPDALIGRALRDMADPVSRDLVEQRVQRLATGESLEVASHRFIRLDGAGHVDLEAVSIPIPYDGGTAALTVARDVTERNRLEHELRHSQRMDAVGQLAGGVAHDFNNLLTVIIGYAQLVLSGTAPEEDLHGYAQQTLEAANRAASLTRQLLAFSRKQVSQPREVVVSEIVAGMESMLRRLLGPATELRISRGEGAGIVRIDPVQLDQVILNLALNGRDAMPDGGVLSIESRVVTVPGSGDARWDRLPAGRYVALAVRDRGTGIDDAIRDRIFDPFFTTKSAERGTGLGLATVYGIVTAAKGAVFVDSAVGAGSVFTVLLPALDRTEATPTARGRDAAALPVEGESRRVMVVEDDAAVRVLTRRVLEHAGYRVVEAADGQSALATLTAGTERVDVVVSDLAMPGMNGAALARAIGERYPGLPVIIVSGFADARLEREVAGLTLLSKPVDPPALVAAVGAALAR
ncbi:MAG TPA: response regulator [Gemmatimonadaceae bacterium]|nr:response regulator [Gemmatimonadaceae bacterium]